MRASMEIELHSDDIQAELKEVIQEIAEEEIRKMVRTQAQEMVKESVTKIIAPIVDEYLKVAIVGHDYCSNWEVRKADVDKYIKNTLINYLNEPVYLYSKNSNKLSERYMGSSDNGDKRSRAEHWVTDIAQKFANEELWVKLERSIQATINAITPSEDELNNILRKEISERLKL